MKKHIYCFLYKSTQLIRFSLNVFVKLELVACVFQPDGFLMVNNLLEGVLAEREGSP